MKKILFAAAALVALVSCNNDEVISRPEGAAIGFDNTFVENTTRVATDLTKGSFDFGVYGTVAKDNANALIFDNQQVAADGSYSPAQYWVAAADYTFTAFAPYTNAKWGYTATDAYNGTVTFNNAEALGEQDFIFAAAKRTTDATINAAPAKVGFTFGHMLSKVAFKFTNNFVDKNITLKVYNVKVNNAAATGTMPVVNGIDGEWTGAGDYARAFGPATADDVAIIANAGGQLTTEHFYLIPVERAYNITFDVALYQAGVLLQNYEHEVNTTIAFEKGKSYSINAVLAPENVNPEEQLYPIEFQVDAVEEWVNATVEISATEVATADELKAAVAAGGNIRLTQDMTLSSDELVVAAGNEVNVDLNGQTLTVAALDPIKNNGTMTIANGKIEAGAAEGTRRCIYNYGEMTINNVEFVQTYNKKGAAINNEGKMTINNATVDAVFYSIWASGANSETTINGGTYTTTNDVTVRDTWAYAVNVLNGAKMTINGGSFTGNHGVVGTESGGQATINGGTFNCTATYTGNSDWVFYANGAGSLVKYDADNCTLIHATKPANNCNATEDGGVVEAF